MNKLIESVREPLDIHGLRVKIIVDRFADDILEVKVLAGSWPGVLAANEAEVRAAILASIEEQFAEVFGDDQSKS